MNIPFTFQQVDHPVSIYDYYMKIRKPSVLELVRQYTIGLPGVFKASVKGSQTVSRTDKNGPLVMDIDIDVAWGRFFVVEEELPETVHYFYCQTGCLYAV